MLQMMFLQMPLQAVIHSPAFSYLKPMKRFGIVMLFCWISLMSMAQQNRIERIDLKDEAVKLELLSPWHQMAPRMA